MPHLFEQCHIQSNLFSSNFYSSNSLLFKQLTMVPSDWFQANFLSTTRTLFNSNKFLGPLAFRVMDVSTVVEKTNMLKMNGRRSIKRWAFFFDFFYLLVANYWWAFQKSLILRHGSMIFQNRYKKILKDSLKLLFVCRLMRKLSRNLISNYLKIICDGEQFLSDIETFSSIEDVFQSFHIKYLKSSSNEYLC